MDRSRVTTRAIEPAELVDQLRALDLEEGGVLVVHTSFRKVRPVEGGPAGLIEALRIAVGPEGTIVMPSWGGDDDTPFDPTTTPVTPDLGVTADLFWRLPGVLRSSHPMAFAALGLQAATILADPLPRPPHRPESPIGRSHDLDARILLLGVGHDANTTIHLGEILAKVPYGVPKHCTVLEGGRPRRIDFIENDHCCQRFTLVDGWMRSRELQRVGRVGHADARLMRAQDVVRVVTDRLARNPLVFLHESGSGCAECDAARASVH
jgi:aminoglycoside 3-N-acetyltransferase